MYMIEALENSRPIDFVFADRQQAQDFIDFVLMYVGESGAGNGYDAYWMISTQICQVDNIANSMKGFLNSDLIKNMALAICDARMARDHMSDEVTEPEYMPQLGYQDGLITFVFDADQLPPRLEPQAGDLARIIDRQHPQRGVARVKAVGGDLVTLIPCQLSRLEEETICPSDKVMKVFDFLASA